MEVHCTVYCVISFTYDIVIENTKFLCLSRYLKESSSRITQLRPLKLSFPLQLATMKTSTTVICFVVFIAFFAIGCDAVCVFGVGDTCRPAKGTQSLVNNATYVLHACA